MYLKSELYPPPPLRNCGIVDSPLGVTFGVANGTFMDSFTNDVLFSVTYKKSGHKTAQFLKKSLLFLRIASKQNNQILRVVFSKDQISPGIVVRRTENKPPFSASSIP